MASISQVTADRAKAIERLVLAEDRKTSQWLRASPFATCLCIAVASTEATWRVQALLPDKEVVQLGYYVRSSKTGSKLFNPSKPLYLKSEVMCGLPIRFVATVEQINPILWVIFKS
ncbi:hypothetical protein [Allorhodopirellula heiligendammensis]|uniref:Uncharacterized protein n=1 Tax=Allorhodopirellula heiligendammensis TaxID=2714739 RepID=A0A5C6C8X7_9BACT|nr:hypothetical protein [Allorhodopirellula heiligendammensis]TWU19856.1 hypothetical protein Poly21_20340 [Allorhodopirellula heiligendammensis]